MEVLASNGREGTVFCLHNLKDRSCQGSAPLLRRQHTVIGVSIGASSPNPCGTSKTFHQRDWRNMLQQRMGLPQKRTVQSCGCLANALRASLQAAAGSALISSSIRLFRHKTVGEKQRRCCWLSMPARAVLSISFMTSHGFAYGGRMACISSAR